MILSSAGTGAASAGALYRRLHRGFLAIEIVTAGKPIQESVLLARFLCQSLAALFVFARDTELMKAESPPRN